MHDLIIGTSDDTEKAFLARMFLKDVGSCIPVDSVDNLVVHARIEKIARLGMVTMQLSSDRVLDVRV